MRRISVLFVLILSATLVGCVTDSGLRNDRVYYQEIEEGGKRYLVKYAYGNNKRTELSRRFMGTTDDSKVYTF